MRCANAGCIRSRNADVIRSASARDPGHHLLACPRRKSFEPLCPLHDPVDQHGLGGDSGCDVIQVGHEFSAHLFGYPETSECVPESLFIVVLVELSARIDQRYTDFPVEQFLQIGGEFGFGGILRDKAHIGDPLHPGIEPQPCLNLPYRSRGGPIAQTAKIGQPATFTDTHEMSIDERPQGHVVVDIIHNKACHALIGKRRQITVVGAGAKAK